MKKLESLTLEQEARMGEWADRWIEVGLNTDEADWGASEEAIRECYRFAGLPWHGRYIRIGNPMALSVAAPTAAAMIEAKAAGKDATEETIRQSIKSRWSSRLGGTFWVSWQAYESFFREVCELDLETNPRAEAYARAQSASGWWWPHSHFVMVCDRPSAIHLEQIAPRGWGSHRLHCETGPAISYRDGWGLWFWHGQSVPQRLIEDPGSITLEEISGEENVEVRRVMIERYGSARYLTDIGAEIVEMDMEGARKGAAPRALVRDKDGEAFLIGTDGGTGRVYAMPVDPEAKTPAEAHRSICGFDETRILNKS